MPLVPSAPDVTVFCLHHLGGSRRSWEAFEGRLPPSVRAVPLDLPGFGEAAALTGFDVASMADHVADLIGRAGPPKRFILAGHSMGAKVAVVLARRAEDGDRGLANLRGLVLVAGSPPSPEPIGDDRRRAMLSSFAGGEPDRRRREAEDFVAASTAETLPAALRARAVDDVLRASNAAWRAWLESGSREDWAARVGVLRTPSLLLAGGADEDLGPDAQASLVAPHFVRARLETLDAAGHLLPLERPEALAELVAGFAADLAEASPSADPGGPALPEDFRRLIEGPRVSARTRNALLDRVRPIGIDLPRCLAPPVLAVLDAVLGRVIPPDGDAPPIDLARRIDVLLASGRGDGWRFSSMPPDPDAMRLGLRTLDAASRAGDGRPFVVLDADRQDALLARCADGTLDADGPDLLDREQMRRWFEDVRAHAVRFFVAHPATLARLGFSGIAYGGDGPDKPGFVRIGPGETEAWEPAAP